MQGNSQITKVPGHRAPQILLITIFCDLVPWIITLENWICLFTISDSMRNLYSKGPRSPGPPNHISYYTLGPGGLDYNFGELKLVVYHWNIAKEIVYPKGLWTPGPPNHISYYIKWFGGLDCHFGELDVLIYQWQYIGNCISQRSRDHGSPKQY